MSEFPFQKFIKLVAFDQGLRALEQQLATIVSEMHVHEAEVEKLSGELEVAKRHKDAMQREVDRQEHEMAALQKKQQEKERLLDKTVNARESQSIYHEIALIKQEQFDFEENLLQAWHKLEGSLRDYAALKQDLENRLAALQEKIAHNKQQQEVINQALVEQQEKRLEQEQGIPLEWLERYALMRRTVANPVVPAVGNSCGGCFYQIIAQDLVRLRHNALLQCKNCYRFLYMETI